MYRCISASRCVAGNVRMCVYAYGSGGAELKRASQLLCAPADLLAPPTKKGPYGSLFPSVVFPFVPPVPLSRPHHQSYGVTTEDAGLHRSVSLLRTDCLLSPETAAKACRRVAARPAQECGRICELDASGGAVCLQCPLIHHLPPTVHPLSSAVLDSSREAAGLRHLLLSQLTSGRRG